MASEPRKLTRAELKEAKTLVEECWASDLDDALMELFEDFTEWADKEMSPFELVEKIHEFHKGPSRELYLQYSNTPAATTVAHAVASGQLSEESLSEGLLEKLAEDIEYFRRLRSKKLK